MTIYRIFAFSPSLLAAFASPATAHHVADGKTPSSWFEGVLSGLAHPVIGIDHLAFIVVIGLFAALARQGLRIATAFSAALLFGVVLHMSPLRLPVYEVLVAGSVVLAGIGLILRRHESDRVWPAVAAVAGVVHGYALGESVALAPSGVLPSYLFGLALALTLIITPVRAFATLMLAEAHAKELKIRAVGGAVIALGVFFVASAIATAST